MKKKTTKTVAGRQGSTGPVLSRLSEERTAYGELRYRTPICADEFKGTTGSKPKAVILDIDDTIYVWGGLNQDILGWLDKHDKAGHVFLIATARDQWSYESSFNWLMKDFPYPFAALVLRAKDDPRYAPEYKRELAEIWSGLYDIVGAADDDSYVLKMWKQWAIEKFTNPADFDIYEALPMSYTGWRKSLPSKVAHRSYGGTSWGTSDVKGTYTAPAASGSYIWDKDPADGKWKRTSEFITPAEPVRDDDVFDDLSDEEILRQARNNERFDLEDDVLASYPDLRMADVVRMDIEELREKMADAINSNADDTAPLDVAEIWAGLDEKPFGARRELTDELMTEVAQAYLNAPLGGRQAAAGAVLGIDGHRASYYINLARQRGLLAPVNGDMRVEEIA